jgi:hypothetical protein
VSASVATSEDELGPPVPRLRDGLRECVLVFVAVRVALSVLSWAAVAVVPVRTGLPVVPGWAIGPVTQGWRVMLTATERQDAAWFLRIATGGYAAGDGSAAFFPLYPMAIRALAWLPGIGPLGAALVVSNACFLGALVMVHGLTRLEGMSAQVARTTVLLLAIFPTAFFFLAPYTEASFLLLSVAAFWFARRDRWALAALAGALAALTRSIGVLLVFALAVEAIQRSREDGRPLLPRLAAAAAIAIGPALYFLYWAVAHDDFWAPLDAQRAWQRVFTFPGTALLHAVQYAWRYGTYWLIDIVVVGIVLVAAIAGVRRLRPAYSVYALASLALPLFEPFPDRPLLSMPRFVIVIFPAFWVMADAVERRWVPEPLAVGVFSGGYALLAALFLNWWNVF